MSGLKGLLFDLDGVIVDTARFHYLAWKRLANELGFDFTIEDNEQLKGISRVQSLEILLAIGKVKLSEEEKDRYANQKNEWYLEYIDTMTESDVLPGVKQFLKEVKSANVKMAIGSASKNANKILSKLNLTYFFEAIVDGNMVNNAKPDPEVFLKGAELLNVNPDECVVFEDSIAGIEAAINGKMKCVGIGDSQVLDKAHVVVPGFENFSINKLLILF